MFNIRKHDCIKFPSTQLNSCKKFKEMSPECKAKALEEQSSCALCTSFVHEIERCHLKRRGQATPTCGVSEGNNIYAAESTTICCIYQKAGTARQQPHSRTWENLGQSLCLTESTVGGADSGIAFMMEDSGARENFITHTLAKELSLARIPATVVNTSIGAGYDIQPY